jgi:hypothetical protein
MLTSVTYNLNLRSRIAIFNFDGYYVGASYSTVYCLFYCGIVIYAAM